MEITLTEDEMRVAATAGIERMIHVIVAGRGNRHGESDWGAWQRHVEGAMGEQAVAKALGVEWDPHIGRVDRPDLQFGGLVVEVRTRRYGKAELITHPEDRDDAVFILAVGMNGSYRLAGWITGADSKHQRFWGDNAKKNRPAFWVPQEELYPMKQLLGQR